MIARDQQHDRLSRSRSLSDAVANVSLTSTLPPTTTQGSIELVGEGLDLVASRELGVLVEVAGDSSRQ